MMMMMSEMMENRAEVPARDKVNEAEDPAGSVPRPLRNDAEPARGGDPLELADDWIPAPLPSFLMNVAFPLFFVAQLLRV